ncbi:MAG TPA: YkvA family protein, partial [Bryobacteraceae bacterium]|nr:YkvA family protein [Bryobacteraceae bacterium]
MRGAGEKTFWPLLRKLLGRRRPQDGDEAYVKRAFWPKVKRAGAKIPFVKEAVAMYFCALDPETPIKAKGIALAALAYFVLPLDAIPDVVAA